MDRRNFLRTMGVTAAAAAVAETGVQASPFFKDKKKAEKKESGLRVRFLGTGAADWKGPDDRGEHRRLSSVLLDNRILIDFTPTDEDMLPEGCKPECIFYTHSHGDHYNPEALLKLGVPKAYLGKTWISKAWKGFNEASAKTEQPVPEIVPLGIGETTVCGDIAITALPANHAIDAIEQALIYLIEKGPVRLIYATDTGGIMGVAARISGIDPHVKNGTPITGLIMEATMGMGAKGDEDYRLFTHSSVNTVHRTVKMLLRRKRLIMKEGEQVYLTHLARTLHPTQAELDATLPAPLKAAYDGLEVVFDA
ncbi:MAG: MBL fold metallo-hydrolase [Bacteroidales bacterium]|nr:MBL fold metallo-hydrolase [Bacteroidales bacterium]